MFRLLYISSASRNLSNDDLHEILDKAQQNNAKLDVTGMLVYMDGNFVQFLEGSKENVMALYNKIQRDDRHRDVLIIDQANVSGRFFESWSMAFQKINRFNAKDYPVIKEFLDNPQKSADVIDDLIAVFIDLITHK